MAFTHDRVSGADTQLPPVVHELEAIFRELPDEELLTKLRGQTRRGPKGYNPEILWRCYVAYYYLSLESVSALIRALYDNPYLAAVCGINAPGEIPSQPTFSRFGTKLSRREYSVAVKNVLRGLTRKLFDTFPDFGKSVAIDSTDIKAWSNGGKIRKGKPSDTDAGWIVKQNTEGRKKYVGGYKVHILADTQYELPIVVDTSKGNLHDVNKATPLLQQARFTYSKFRPDYVICDKGYSSEALRKAIKRQYRAEPIIDPHPRHKRIIAKTPKTAEWKMLYNRRIAIERLNGRLKAHRRLNDVRVRGRLKLKVHAMLSTIVCQAQALATETRASVRKVA